MTNPIATSYALLVGVSPAGTFVETRNPGALRVR